MFKIFAIINVTVLTFFFYYYYYTFVLVILIEILDCIIIIVIFCIIIHLLMLLFFTTFVIFTNLFKCGCFYRYYLTGFLSHRRLIIFLAFAYRDDTRAAVWTSAPLPCTGATGDSHLTVYHRGTEVCPQPPF